MTDTEPSENLGGDTPATDGFAEPAGEPATRAEAVVDALGERYWRKHYGGQPALRCLVRTILSQNTSDVASQPAFDRLIERFDGDGDLARSLAEADRADLVAAIESAGLYNRKSRVIQRVSEAILEEWGSAEAFDAFVREASSETVRDRLLAFDGVGPKTADCVLLFASGREGVFPVDTHVHRIARRMGLAPPDGDHETVRDHLESAVPAEKCGFGHTAMIQFGREVCTASSPACLEGPGACPLAGLCDRIGVDPDAGVVVDPAAAEE